jgi:hypothetical protein
MLAGTEGQVPDVASVAALGPSLLEGQPSQLQYRAIPLGELEEIGVLERLLNDILLHELGRLVLLDRNHLLLGLGRV